MITRSGVCGTCRSSNVQWNWYCRDFVWPARAAGRNSSSWIGWSPTPASRRAWLPASHGSEGTARARHARCGYLRGRADAALKHANWVQELSLCHLRPAVNRLHSDRRKLAWMRLQVRAELFAVSHFGPAVQELPPPT